MLFPQLPVRNRRSCPTNRGRLLLSQNLPQCLIQDRILITDNLLIFFDLIRNTEPKLYQQFLKLFLIYQDFGIGKRLELTAVNVFFNLTN